MRARALAARFCVVALLAIVSNVRGLARQQPIGPASVDGVVLTTEDTPRPIRRAIVSMRGANFALGYHAITDDQGRFQIRDLPPGTYAVSATRTGFVTIEYGASRPGWPGTQLTLAAGQHLTGVTVRMAPGGIITGAVRDDAGAPQRGLTVSVERTTPDGKQFQRYERTDSQGVYRIYGLSPGAYTVMVQPLKLTSDVVYARNDSEVDAIFQQLQLGRFSGPQRPLPRQPITSQPTSDFTTIYYPSAFTEDEALPVVVLAGEERSGVDLTIRLMSKTRLEGRVVTSRGQPVSTGSVNLVRASQRQLGRTSASLRPDGTFDMSGVSPGRYQLVATRGSVAGTSPTPCEFAATDLEVMSIELRDIVLVLKPCLKITARVEVAADAAPGTTRTILSGTQVRLEADRSGGAPMYTLLPLQQIVGAAGMVRLGDGLQLLVPGSYLIHAHVPESARGKGWWLESARTEDGRDVLDVPLTLTAASPETTNIVLTFTDRHTSLSGSLVTSAGRPAIDYTVIAFTANRAWWRPPFRRVLTARPGTDGAFVLHDLPPGDYFLAALAEVGPNEWLDAAFLEQAARAAIRLTISSGDAKVQHLQIRSGGVPSR